MNGEITFQTADTFKEGNAVIAAKDAEGTILWSWHIWLTDQPKGQEYYNNAGTVMDRNLGATSASPGDVGALGLLYQWGRKDPFLGSSSISSLTRAESTISWPDYIAFSQVSCTINWSIANPTTYLFGSSYDWLYMDDLSEPDPSKYDNDRWTTSIKAKSIYDPCPQGWRIPDGGKTGLWAKAINTEISVNASGSTGFDAKEYLWYVSDKDIINKGINFSNSFGSDNCIWYPFSSNLDCTGSLSTGSIQYWTATPYYSDNKYIDHLEISVYGDVYLCGRFGGYRNEACSVRCIKE